MHRTHHRDAGQRDYLPAFGIDLLLPLYDTLQRLLGMPALHRRLIEMAGLRPGQRVLDVGCGTGNLLVAIGQRHPDVELFGIDPDPRALARSRRKAERGGLAVRWDRGYAQDLPYPDQTFDVVFSTLMLHHLEADAKDGMLSEVRRVLRPRGTLLLADIGGTVHASGGRLARLVSHSARVQDNFGDRVPRRMRAVGLADVTETVLADKPVGRVMCWTASAPESDAA